jgi:hypothetical protein
MDLNISYQIIEPFFDSPISNVLPPTLSFERETYVKPIHHMALSFETTLSRSRLSSLPDGTTQRPKQADPTSTQVPFFAINTAV